MMGYITHFYKRPGSRCLSQKLWDWFTEFMGESPDAIYIHRPGYWQLKQGFPRFTITHNGNDYPIWDMDEAREEFQ
jgi:hypothetical protein